jgi:outer membrane lipopolysaccharide assembly protein LptE/RlpB
MNRMRFMQFFSVFLAVNMVFADWSVLSQKICDDLQSTMRLPSDKMPESIIKIYGTYEPMEVAIRQMLGQASVFQVEQRFFELLKSVDVSTQKNSSKLVDNRKVLELCTMVNKQARYLDKNFKPINVS